jgi:hypothetical protein
MQLTPKEVETMAAERVIPTSEPSDEHVAHVPFTAAAYAQLREMAQRRGRSVAETIRDALSLDLWVEQQMHEGNKLLVERRDGQVFTLLVPRA